MIGALTLLLLFQLAGEVVVHLLALPLPGPVLGMALLLAYLLVNENAVAALRPTCVELLKHLSLLFVPAGVGVMLHVARIASEWLPILVALVTSTALAIVVTALVIEWTSRWLAREPSP